MRRAYDEKYGAGSKEEMEEKEEMKALEKCAELKKRINMLVSENAELKKQLAGKQDKILIYETLKDISE